jgi:hypothetical protein
MLAALILRAFEVILFWHLCVQSLKISNSSEPVSFLEYSLGTIRHHFQEKTERPIASKVIAASIGTT